jgi:uncharacterized PurR-regulated membrane protein YhhQ (DUF165 family)
MGRFAKFVFISFYIFAAIIGFLFVAYHLFAIWYSSLGEGKAVSILGIILAFGNLVYPVCILLLLTVRTLRPYAYKKRVLLAVMVLIPVIFWLNYLLVENLSPYDYQS